jgi:hypothetical protein
VAEVVPGVVVGDAVAVAVAVVVVVVQ